MSFPPKLKYEFVHPVTRRCMININVECESHAANSPFAAPDSVNGMLLLLSDTIYNSYSVRCAASAALPTDLAILMDPKTSEMIALVKRESVITVWPHDARRWCFDHATEMEGAS